MAAKKKAPKKKIAKKKVAKKVTKTSAASTSKSATKKPAKKKVSKPVKPKPKPKAKPPSPVTIKYSCGPLCKADVKHKHMDQGASVTLHATNTGVTIEFQDESPFVSGHGAPGHPFTIPNNTKVFETAKNKSDEYVYTLDCDSCAKPADNPSMIID